MTRGAKDNTGHLVKEYDKYSDQVFNKMMQKEKEQLVEICFEIAQKKMVSGTGGNVSIRIKDIVFITPSGYPVGSLKTEDISELEPDGKHIAGLKPSKETPFHLAIYKDLPSINAVIHTHSFYSVCIGLMAQNENFHDVMPSYTPSFVMKVGRAPLIPFKTPGSDELSQAIVSTLSENGVSGVLLQNHGLVTIGNNLREALNIAEEIEENAKIHIVLGGRGRRLSIEEICDIDARYKR